MFAIETKKLTRVHGRADTLTEQKGIHDLSLTVKRGEVKGLLGPNGAGKTTLTKVLATILQPTSGSASVFGYDLKKDARKIKSLIGLVLGGDRGLYPYLSARENLIFWATLYGISGNAKKIKVAHLLDKFGLTDVADENAGTYSRGMIQRLHLARGLIGDPHLLFLDEPTLGMDPVAAREFRKTVAQLKQEGISILLATHDMAEAEAVCDEVALLSEGRLLAVESPTSLGRLISQYERIDFYSDLNVLDHIKRIDGVDTIHDLGRGHYRACLSNYNAVTVVLSLLISAGITTINTSRPKLEEVYLELIGGRGFSV